MERTTSEHLSNMTKTWKGIKDILNINNKTGPQISQLVYNGKQINSNRGVANVFNDFFTKVGPNLDYDIPKKTRSPSIYLDKGTRVPRVPESFLIAPTTPNDRSEIIGALDGTKSAGTLLSPYKIS